MAALRGRKEKRYEKICSMMLMAAMITFVSLPAASAEEYLVTVLVDQNGDVYVVEEEKEEEEVLVVDEPVESGDVYVVQ